MKKLPAVFILLFLQLFAKAQQHTINIIDVYGLQKVSVFDIRKMLSFKEGDIFDPTTFNTKLIEEKLLSIPSVKKSNVTAVCCDDKNGMIIYAGISENDTTGFGYNSPGAGTAVLTSDIVHTYSSYDSVWRKATEIGQATEDDSKGHVLLVYPPAIPIQEKFITIANSQLDLLRTVLKRSADASQRAIAAWIIPFTNNKKDIIPDLLYAVQDEDDIVRNNATRALAVLSRYAADNASAGIKIPSAPFIKMANSVVWSDRNKGMAVLEAMTKDRDKTILKELQKNALPSLIEMAKWKNPGHAFFSFLIIGRMADIDDNTIFNSLNSEKRNSFVDSWVAIIKTK